MQETLLKYIEKKQQVVNQEAQLKTVIKISLLACGRRGRVESLQPKSTVDSRSGLFGMSCLPVGVTRGISIASSRPCTPWHQARSPNRPRAQVRAISI